MNMAFSARKIRTIDRVNILYKEEHGGGRPALEVLDVTFALNLGWATSAADCARRVIYQPLNAPGGNPIYHPTIVGDDFFLRSGGAHSALTFTCVNIGI